MSGGRGRGLGGLFESRVTALEGGSEGMQPASA